MDSYETLSQETDLSNVQRMPVQSRSESPLLSPTGCGKFYWSLIGWQDRNRRCVLGDMSTLSPSVTRCPSLTRSSQRHQGSGLSSWLLFKTPNGAGSDSLLVFPEPTSSRATLDREILERLWTERLWTERLRMHQLIYRATLYKHSVQIRKVRLLRNRCLRTHYAPTNES